MTAARPPAPSRRAVLTMLTGAGALTLTACTGTTVVVAPPPTADQRLAARVAVQVRALSALYAAAAARHPDLRATLAPFAAEHAAHLRALTALTPLLAARPTPPPTSSSSPSSASSSASPSGLPSVPATPAATRAALVDAERAAARRRRAQCRTAGGELARLLASIAAAEAVHAVLL